MIPRKDKFRGEYKLIPVAKKMKRFLRAEGAELWKESELSDFILNPKESDMILNPPALPVYEVDNTTTTIDFPLWATLSCDEILKAIEKLKYTMTVIRVDEATYNMYLSQIAFGEDTYAKKCTGGIKTPVGEFPKWDTLSCDQIMQAIDKLKYTMTVIRVDETTYNMYIDQINLGQSIYDKKCRATIQECPPGEGMAVVDGVEKCVPIGGGGGDTGGGGTGSGSGGGTGGTGGGGTGSGSGGGTGGGGGMKEEKKMPYSWLWLVFMAAGVYVLTRKSE
jgi:hypothetical protein